MKVYAQLMHVLGVVIVLPGSVAALSCWHCIADNCEQNPEDNYKAAKRQCLEGQFCQKVTFEMHSDVGSATYSSVVRSCAENCMDQDDFRQNCSNWLLTTRGCVKRTCCNDEDLCNGAAIPSTHLWCLGPFTALVWLLGTHLL
ncbi:uncharacterized protein LOC112564765 isoform X2 [Pomacea canaliculata]|uniref:uncharacterized protein LOC112564765 isoform X1 n=1 Tax=Pomacea canaliculata TaxID=400727 RepID=UPI000D73FDB8|nr:uncharacterized protein LOC112564765 isoform X1 [Pomacea canaliculata]XP_025095611.1 uncharacterized protein LOC112564765 isoform X2 [Pomacea canaliculata]